MRLGVSRYLDPRPAQVKKAVSQVTHLSAPLKGLSQSSKLTPGDPLSATVLTNFVVEDDRIQSRAGFVKLFTHADAKPIECLIPYYGTTQRLGAATNGKILDGISGTLIKGGFTSNDWHWTSFSNLADRDFTVMVNGADGVWSWDGTNVTTDAAPVTVTNLSKANPAVCTVALADITKFSNGMQVVIAGGTGTGMTNANGPHVITSVNSPANTFTLVGVDTSSAAADQTTGVTADPPATGGIVKEIITVPAGNPWIDPNKFHITLTHMNRLWFADKENLCVFYLPVDQKSTVTATDLKWLPLNAVFRRGGYIKAMYTWTIDGGAGLDDQLVLFSSNGEAVIFGGVDPNEDFKLTGIFRFDAPMSKHSCVNYGGDLYVLISTGVVPMTTVIREESEHLGQSDKSVLSLFLGWAVRRRDVPGWQIMLNPSTGRLICNVPQGAPNKYTQMVRHMPRAIWASWEDIPSRCWGWIDPYVYFGDDSGSVYRMHPQYLNDNGQPIHLDVQMAWSQYKTPAIKHFKLIQPYIMTDGDPKPQIEVKVNYDYTPPINQPDVTFSAPGNEWDVSTWDVDYWASGEAKAIKLWTGVGAKGTVGAPRLSVRILNCSFALSGFDVTYETGAVMG